MSESWHLKKLVLPHSSVQVQEFVPGRELSLAVGGPGAWLPSGTRRERADLFLPTRSTLIKLHAQLAPFVLDLTYEVPLTSGARRHRFSQRSLSFYIGSLTPGPNS